MRSWSVVPVEWAGPDPVETVATHLRSLGLDSSGVALLGPVSERLAGALRVALPAAALKSLAGAFTRARLVKHSEEIAWLTYAAALCDAAIASFLAEARPGMREDELAHLLDSGHARLGGQTGICFLPTASMATGGAVVPAQVPSRRVVRAGDLAVFELSAGVGGYTSQILRTVAIAAEVPPHIRHLHDVSRRRPSRRSWPPSGPVWRRPTWKRSAAGSTTPA